MFQVYILSSNFISWTLIKKKIFMQDASDKIESDDAKKLL